MKNYLKILGSFAFLAFSNLSLAAAQPKPGDISMKKAENIALKVAPGKIKSSEYEFENGQNVYSFDIIGKDNKIHEVLVGALTGKIVSSTIESAAKESAESAADKNSTMNFNIIASADEQTLNTHSSMLFLDEI